MNSYQSLKKYDQNFFSKNSKNVSPKNKTLKHKNINTIFLVAL